jgi:hypothetical protein
MRSFPQIDGIFSADNPQAIRVFWARGAICGPTWRGRPTRLGDLAHVLELQGDRDNSAFIGSWSHAEHAA